MPRAPKTPAAPRTHADMLKTALYQLTMDPIARYLIVNTEGRMNGSVKAEKHREITEIFLSVAKGCEPDACYLYIEEYALLHDATQSELTNHLDQTIGFDKTKGPTEQNMRDFFERFFEVASRFFPAADDPAPMPDVVYHGTSVERWDEAYSNGDLYVTTDRAVAEGYAREWAEEGEAPIVVAIDLMKVHRRHITLQRNWETFDQAIAGHWGALPRAAGDLTWRDTMKLNGTFVIRGFDEACKRDVVVTPLDDCEVGTAPAL